MATPSASPPGPDYQIVPAAGRHWLTPFYDLGCEVLGLGRGFRRDVAVRLSLGDAERLLDVGCGTGGLLAEALRRHRGLFAAGVDADPAILEIAARRLGRWRGRVALHTARAESLPAPDGTFDVAVSTLAFHHLPTPAKLAALGEILRVLRPGGRFLLADFGAAAGHRPRGGCGRSNRSSTRTTNCGAGSRSTSRARGSSASGASTGGGPRSSISPPRNRPRKEGTRAGPRHWSC